MINIKSCIHYFQVRMKYLSKQTSTWATEKVSTSLELLKVDCSRIILEISKRKIIKKKRRRRKSLMEEPDLQVCACHWLAGMMSTRKHPGYLQIIIHLLIALSYSIYGFISKLQYQYY